MKVLYIYPKGNALIQKHVEMLAEGLRQSADICITDSYSSFKQNLKDHKPDIVHCHGCWNYDVIRAGMSGRKAGARIVLTPHGQMEPWAVEQQTPQAKAGRIFQWQKKCIQRSYTIITLGQLEQRNFLELKWNRRVEVIHNAIITNTITPSKMCSQTFAVYQKVIDSNTFEQMDDTTIDALSIIIKAGITGDRRWCRKMDAISHPQDIDWRRLLIYASHENIRNYIDYGISILGLSMPNIDTSKIASYYPDSYTTPRPIKEYIGDYQGNETNYLVKMISQLYRQPLLLHMIELTRELMRETVNDDQLCEALEEKKLKGYTASLMQVLGEETELDEGYMPIQPVDNRQTNQIRKLLTNHLKI
jgi:hypothetical protein